MTDIIERLERQWAALDPVDEYRADARDAIEEIARLRAAIEIPCHSQPDVIDLSQAKRLIAQQSGELVKLRAELDALKAQEPALPEDVRAALDRMCSPLHESRLSGVTAREDARCMELIRGYIERAPAPQPATPDGWIAIHLKTGNEYRVTGEAINVTNAQDGQTMVIYERDGLRYVREAGEFMEKFAAKGDAK